MYSNKSLLSLLTSAVRGESADAFVVSSLSEEEIAVLYKTAKKHDLAHLVAAALENAEPQVKQRYKPFFAESVKAMYRYEWLKGEQNKIFALLEKLEIPYIPLKGAVIRDLYREPWHRMSCDIDVLVPEKRLEEAASAFERELSYTRGMLSRHELSFTAANGVHLELHFDIDEVYVDRNELWADASAGGEAGYRYVLSAEMLVLNHISHMAKHFVSGGCGLRPFLDLWLMREKLTYDGNKLAKMLESHGLADFARAMLGVVDVWFNGKTADDTERMAEEFVFHGGVYGDLDNRISVTRAKGKGQFAYVVSRIFPPRSALKITYPTLEKHGWLLPVCWVRRWVRLLFAGKLKQVKTEYDINRRLNSAELNETSKLLEKLKLK